MEREILCVLEYKNIFENVIKIELVKTSCALIINKYENNKMYSIRVFRLNDKKEAKKEFNKYLKLLNNTEIK